MALQLHSWNFSTKRALLSRLADPPAFGFDFQYALPTGYLSTNEVHPMNMVYIIEDGKLLTDYDAPGLVYTWDNTDTGQYSPMFVATVELVLAIRLSLTMTERMDRRQSFRDELIQTLTQAKIRDAKENPAKEIGPVEMDLVRRVFTDGSHWDC